MAKSDNEQAERVRSARAWLERAEKSFDNKADVRENSISCWQKQK